MRAIVLLGLAAALALTAGAAERRKIDAAVIYGRWLGIPGGPPADCKADGYIVELGSSDKVAWLMTVRRQVNGVVSKDGTETTYVVVTPPPGAPTSIEFFLTSTKSDLGVHVRTGSVIELFPAGPDKSYSKSSLVMIHCGA